MTTLKRHKSVATQSTWNKVVSALFASGPSRIDLAHETWQPRNAKEDAETTASPTTASPTTTSSFTSTAPDQTNPFLDCPLEILGKILGECSRETLATVRLVHPHLDSVASRILFAHLSFYGKGERHEDANYETDLIKRFQVLSTRACVRDSIRQVEFKYARYFRFSAAGRETFKVFLKSAQNLTKLSIEVLESYPTETHSPVEALASAMAEGLSSLRSLEVRGGIDLSSYTMKSEITGKKLPSLKHVYLGLDVQIGDGRFGRMLETCKSLESLEFGEGVRFWDVNDAKTLLAILPPSVQTLKVVLTRASNDTTDTSLLTDLQQLKQLKSVAWAPRLAYYCQPTQVLESLLKLKGLHRLDLDCDWTDFELLTKNLKKSQTWKHLKRIEFVVSPNPITSEMHLPQGADNLLKDATVKDLDRWMEKAVTLGDSYRQVFAARRKLAPVPVLRELITVMSERRIESVDIRQLCLSYMLLDAGKRPPPMPFKLD